MSVGTLITLSPEGIIVRREPFWPRPGAGLFPRKNPDGSTTYYTPASYFHFPILQPVPEELKKCLE